MNQAKMEYEYADPETPTGVARSAEVVVYIGWFPDVPPGHWAYDAVMACVGGHVVFGYDDGLYRPDVKITRNQMAVYTARAVCGGDDEVYPAEPPPTFPDVDEDNWGFDYVEFCVGADIVTGYVDGNYHPEWQLTRGQLAVFVARARNWVSIDDDMTTAPQLFPDVPAGFWAGTAIQACQEHDVVQGYPDGTYRPTVSVTRDQMAVYVARAFGLQ